MYFFHVYIYVCMYVCVYVVRIYLNCRGYIAWVVRRQTATHNDYLAAHMIALRSIVWYGMVSCRIVLYGIIYQYIKF